MLTIHADLKILEQCCENALQDPKFHISNEISLETQKVVGIRRIAEQLIRSIDEIKLNIEQCRENLNRIKSQQEISREVIASGVAHNLNVTGKVEENRIMVDTFNAKLIELNTAHSIFLQQTQHDVEADRIRKTILASLISNLEGLTISATKTHDEVSTGIAALVDVGKEIQISINEKECQVASIKCEILNMGAACSVKQGQNTTTEIMINSKSIQDHDMTRVTNMQSSATAVGQEALAVERKLGALRNQIDLLKSLVRLPLIENCTTDRLIMPISSKVLKKEISLRHPQIPICSIFSKVSDKRRIESRPL